MPTPEPLRDFAELDASRIGERVEFVHRYQDGARVVGTVTFVRPGSHVMLADADRWYMTGDRTPSRVAVRRMDWTLNWGWRPAVTPAA